uniref:NADH dehydrogenase subunit 2 n=1 Tax=Borboresthes tibialis TaxID=2969963 RepID=UPI002176C647|nr:NADH dehydrogenase subunit 2 [Borboresthes tibialis]UUL71613.1 NADH dehydrogenase subunit 2 [Borboresthes tibialis]
MKINKIIFLNSMILGTLIAISSYSWMSMWMGLEINLLSIIPLFSESKNIFASESAMKYFITQAMASLILLTAVIMLLTSEEFISPLMNFSFNMMMNTALLTKLGAAPMHFWFPEVIEGLSWSNSLILLTWQKIAPMMLIMNMNMSKTFLVTIIVMCLLISTISGFNQISLRKIMAFSSINHIAWMLSTLLMSLSTWTVYFVTYVFMNINITMIFSSTKSFYLNQINNVMNQQKPIKFCLQLNFLSLGGLPPFVGFLPKWLAINWMTNMNMMFLSALMIATTLIMLFIYIRIMMSSMLLFTNEPKMKSIKTNNFVFMALNMLMITSLILSTLIFNVL